MNKLKKEKYNIESNKNKISASLDALDSKYAFYEELINASEGYPKGVRDVLNNKKIFKGVLGTVGDLLHADKSISSSIELAIGEYAKCIIVENKKDAINILEKIRSRKSGRIMIIPLDSVPLVKVVNISKDLSSNIIGRAVDLVKVPKKFKPLLDFLLGNIVLVKDVNLALSDRKLRGLDIIGQDGTLLIKGMIIDRISSKKNLGLIGRKERLSLIKDKIKTEMLASKMLDKKLDKALRRNLEAQQVPKIEPKTEETTEITE